MTTKYRPIIFGPDSVQKILDGTKTQTRRVVKPHHLHRMERDTLEYGKADYDICPYGMPGDRLWVREAWNVWGPPERQYTDYRATCPDADEQKWRSPIFMPRAASRLTLEVTAVRVERLQDIDRAGATAEGFESSSNGGGWFDERVAFAEAWDAINGKRWPFYSNPWVWVVEFAKVEE